MVGIGPDAHMKILGFRRTAEQKRGISALEAELLPTSDNTGNNRSANTQATGMNDLLLTNKPINT